MNVTIKLLIKISDEQHFELWITLTLLHSQKSAASVLYLSVWILFRVSQTQRSPLRYEAGIKKGWRRSTLPQSTCSTIDATELNDRVRNGIGCDLCAIATSQKIKWLDRNREDNYKFWIINPKLYNLIWIKYYSFWTRFLVAWPSFL